MALDIELARLLLEAHRDGASFRRCVTLGRQTYFLSDSETKCLLRAFEFDPARYPNLYLEARPRFSEPFFEVLGARHLDSVDISSFHGATLLHDLNQPLPPHLAERFDAVCDAGTLEHIFCVPTALSSCMQMVAEGGRLFVFTPANNFFGHGFYQFSPELFYRVLSPENGFRVERMIAVEYGPFRRRYAVANPEAIQRRVSLINRFPVLLFVQALRFERKPVLIRPPQQSDYVAMWAENQGSPSRQLAPMRMARFKRLFLEKAPRLARFLEAFLYSPWSKDYSFRNRAGFSRINDDDAIL